MMIWTSIEHSGLLHTITLTASSGILSGVGFFHVHIRESSAHVSLLDSPWASYLSISILFSFKPFIKNALEIVDLELVIRKNTWIEKSA